jgi:predicted Zn-dependent protease
VNRKAKILNPKLMVVISLSLSGCSEVYRYQPPAPVYGHSNATNPYWKQPEVTTHPLDNNVKSRQQSDVNIQSKSTQTVIANTEINTLSVNKPLSPAVLALVSEADRNSKEGNLESAVSTIERALRIDSRNPTLTYKLAKIRLKQSKPRLAEDLAKKAALLSANNRQLKKQSWLLISEARRRQKNYFGAKEAKLKADSI